MVNLLQSIFQYLGTIRVIVQYVAVGTYTILTIVEFAYYYITKNPANLNMAGLNFSLILLYVFLYLQPFSK